MIGQVTLMASLQLIAHFSTDLLQQKNQQQIQMLETFCWVLITIVVLTSFSSYLILEDTRQLLSLKIGLGPVTCNERDQFVWACKREYPRLINYYLDSGKVEDVNGLNGLNVSYNHEKFVVRYDF